MDKSNLEIVVFSCSTSIDPADVLAVEDKISDALLKVIGLPCSGKVDIPYLMKAFEGGADGVMVVTCKKEDCHYIQGSFRADNRVSAVDDLLEEIGLGRGRIVVTHLDDRGVEGVVEKIEAFRDELSALPTLV